jgi:prolyl oligopeptidase
MRNSNIKPLIVIKKLITLFAFLLLIHSGFCQGIKYPETPVVDSSDTYFGIKISDPYRWLENDSSAETRNWVTAENKVTNDYLAQILAPNKTIVCPL